MINKATSENPVLNKPKYGLFVTGTDTEVGKTWVACLIVKALAAAGHRVGVYKPVASDCVSDGKQLVSEDALALWEAAGRPLSYDAVCPQRFKAPIAPHLAARAEGRKISSKMLRTGISAWADECDVIVVEGAGGLMSPVSDDEFVADLAADFGYPLVIVAPNVLGVINQSLQTLITAACFRDGLPVAGLVLNDSQILDGDHSIASNVEEIKKRAQSPLLAHVRYEARQFDTEIDWMALATGNADD